MADGYNVQEMTAHYIALAQSDPQQYQTIRDKIVDSIEAWAKEKDGNKYAKVSAQNVNDWFEQIEKALTQIQGGNEKAAQTAYNNACKTLGKAIQNTDKANEFEDRKQYPVLFDTTPLKDVSFFPQGDEDDEAVEMEYQGKEVLRRFGPKKTAAKHIEEIQDKVKKAKAMTAEDVAMVIAARQIADTVAGSKSRLESTKIDPVTLKERADELLASEPFKDFIKENLNLDNEVDLTLDANLLTDGHGGQLEKAFGASVRSRQDLQQLDKNLYKRYQNPASGKYDTYEAFLEDGKKDYLNDGKGKITEKDKKVAVHAARMLAAFQLKQKGKAFDQEYFDRKAAEVYNSSQFQFICRHDPDKLNLLTTGDFVGFGNAVNHHMDLIRKVDEDSEERSEERKKVSKDIIVSLKFGTAYGSAPQRRQNAAYNKVMDLFDQKYRFLGCRKNENPGALLDIERAMTGQALGIKAALLENPQKKKELTEQNVKDLLDSSKKMLRYLKKYEGNSYADQLKEELGKVIQTGEKYGNPPEFRDKKGKTAEQQLEEYKTACAAKFQNAAWKFSNNYNDLKKKDYSERADDMKKQLGTPELKKIKIAKQTRQKNEKYTEAVIDDFMNKRGPKYKAMVKAATEYESHGAEDPSKTMKLIDSIVDYQKGKEKLTGSAGARFDNSMMLLANVTVGTPMEKYLDEQIAKVNKARGAKPGDKNFVTKDTYFEGFDADLEPQEKAEKEEAKQREFGLI